jgi:hypothetical protein
LPARLAWLSSLVLLIGSLFDSPGVFPDPNHSNLALGFAASLAFVAGLVLSIVLLAANTSLFARRAIFAVALVAGSIIAIRQISILLFKTFDSYDWPNYFFVGPGDQVSIVLLIASVLLVGSSISKLRENRRPPPDAVFPTRSRIILSSLSGIGGILFFVTLSNLGDPGRSVFSFWNQWPFWPRIFWIAPVMIAAFGIIFSVVLIIRSSTASDLVCGVICALTLAIATYALILLRLQLSSYRLGTVCGLAAALCLISAAVFAVRSARHSIVPTQIPTEARAVVAG